MVRVMDCFFMTCLSASCRGPHVFEGKRLSAVNRFRAHNAMVEERKAGIALPQRKKDGELLGRNWLSRTSAGILILWPPDMPTSYPSSAPKLRVTSSRAFMATMTNNR